ncbi:CDGSH iron-sulfur domain-containing protein 3 [Entomortierella parvispora]|uniref:CDGSH iron-sulfur domain-containing protein 3 n=1 Tax=Entomortierella parvispora TaxID=205924 RepID=A0A9P3LTF1_9FUNG|nr:CDGSH iron-sulfur domain-containing protein 3 [Entomortierella parvispora]
MDIEDLGHLGKKPKVTNYNPCTVRGLKPGSIKEWCTCGLTKKGPWCDGKSHKGTTFKPLRWKVPDGKNTQTMYSICDCRYTTRPPFCDGIHYDLPLRYLQKIKDCPRQPHDPAVTKLCEECGWAGPREMWPELPPSADSDSDSDLSGDDDDEDKKPSEEQLQKQLAANTPKVQVQISSGEHGLAADATVKGEDADSAMDVDQPRACNGSCQTGTEGNVDPEVYRMAQDIQKVHLS